MDLLRKLPGDLPGRARRRAAAAGILGLFILACERRFENPYLPESNGYAGPEWARDGDGDGIADSVEKYAPGCGEGPAECLRRARAKASDAKPLVDLEAVTVEDMALVEGGFGLAPRLRWQPPHIDIVYTLAPDDPAVAEARDALLLPRGAGVTHVTLTARSARGGVARTARFQVSVNRMRVPVASILAEDMRMAPGETAAPRITILPLEATERGYELLTHDPRVVAVRQGSLVAGAAGSTLVTVRTLDGAREALFRVTVKADVRAVTANPMLLQVGVDPQAPTLVFTPADATDRSYTLSGGDPGVAVPTTDLLKVRPVGPGTSWVTVTVEGGLTAALQVTVEPPRLAVKSVKVEDMSFTLLTALDSRLQTPEIDWTPADATERGYSLVSETPAIARIVGDQVQAVRAGETRVTLVTRDGGKRATFDVEVSTPLGCAFLPDCEEEVEDQGNHRRYRDRL